MIDIETILYNFVLENEQNSNSSIVQSKFSKIRRQYYKDIDRRCKKRLKEKKTGSVFPECEYYTLDPIPFLISDDKQYSYEVTIYRLKKRYSKILEKLITKT